MVHVHTGGPLTSAVALTLIAWAVRSFRARQQAGGQQLRRAADGQPGHASGSKQLGDFFASLSPAAVHMLLETNPVPHCVVDVRSREQHREQPLPQDLQCAVNIPGPQLQGALAGPAGWAAALQACQAGGRTPPYPDDATLLVLVCSDEAAMCSAAAAAAQQGFLHVAALQGGLAGYSAGARRQANLEHIGRDAVAGLLGHVDLGQAPEQALILDVRRHDERALYGGIPGVRHVPVAQLPAALQMEQERFQRFYGFPKPQAQDWIVMQCRTNKRSAWAAQLASDAGLQRCLVYRQGTYGWRLHPSVKVYGSYEQGEAPPEPEAAQQEHADAAAARGELQRLGLLM